MVSLLKLTIKRRFKSPRISDHDPYKYMTAETLVDDPIAGKVTKERCYVVPHGPLFGNPPEIFGFRLSSASMRYLWQSDLAEDSKPGGASGQHLGTFTEVTVGKNVVTVWTAHPWDMAMQSFRVTDGKEVFRFQLIGSKSWKARDKMMRAKTHR